MTTTGNVHVNIGGEVSGQIAIGHNIMQIQNYGGVVNVVKPSSRTPFKKRAGHVWQKPRAFPALLDRAQESQVIQSSIKSGISVSVFGQGGVGKTTFLSHMAHLPATNKYPDGVVYLYVREQGFDDLLQILFDAFFSSAGNVMPTIGQLHHHLQGIRAVILLDDLRLARDDTQALIAIMPLSCFVLASMERSLWGEGEVIPLGGLPEQEQVELFEREIRRPLSEEEKIDALIICYYLQGHPLRIIQAASLVTFAGKSISEIKKQFKNDSAPLATEKELWNKLNVSQQKVLAVLGASAGALIPLSIIGTLLKLTDAQGILKSLVDMGLAWYQGSRYGLGGTLVRQVGRLWNLSSWEDSLINYFADWLTHQPKDALIEEASDVLVQVIQKAGEKNRWSTVIQIGRALERILILGRQWQKWFDILNLILKAARALHDRGAEAWALHQLGTRALCLNYADQAGQFLTQALNIRRAIGDQAGMAVTQRNLNVLQGGAPVTMQHRKPPQVKSDVGKYLAYGFGGVATLGVIALIVWLWLQPPPIAPPPTQTSILVIIPSATFPFTSTPSIFTPTITNTFTETSTLTYTPSFTLTYTLTPSYTPSVTPSYTPSITPSRTPTITAFVPSTPPAPGIVMPKGGESFCFRSSIRLEWTKPDDPIGINSYQIQLHRMQLTQWALLINEIAPLVPTVYNTPEYDSGVYEWRIRAKNNNGIWGFWSSWIRYTTSYCEG